MPKKNPWYSPRRWFARDNKQSSRLQKAEIPIAPGSASVDKTLPTFLQLAQSFTTSFGLLPPTIDPQFIDVIFTLSITSPLISQTIFDNITLANSGHIVRLEGASDVRIEAAAASLGDLAKRMHPGGTDGWLNVAMYQIFVAGALSHEWVVSEALDGLERSKFVPTQCIRFKPTGNNDGVFWPFQKARGKTIELNPLTYHYRALIRWENNPYAIPPLFAAIEPEIILRDVRGTIRGIAHKFGLLGLFQILLDQPEQNLDTNESLEDYNIRLRAYLAEAKKNLEEGFKDGILVGFKDKHEFDHERVTGDARGLADITNIVDVDANSGAKTDPILHGRNQSRTETQIRQVYRKMVRQLVNIRAIPSRSIEQGYALHLALAGFPDIDVSIDWKPIDSLDDLRDQQVREQQITNERMLYEDGIISQEQRAQRLGFDVPDLPEPRATPGAVAGFTREPSRIIEMTWQNGAYRRVKKNSTPLISRLLN